MKPMKWRDLALVALLCLCPLLPAAGSHDAANPFYLTLDGAYGRPFSSPGYSGSKAEGFDGALSFEYRGWKALSLGAGFNHIAVMEDGSTTGLGSLDIIGRYFPFGAGPIEPYALLGLGAVAYANAASAMNHRDPSYHANFQLGLLYSFCPNWAAEAALGYQAIGPGDANLNFMELRLGLQARLGSKTSAKKR